MDVDRKLATCDYISFVLSRWGKHVLLLSQPLLPVFARGTGRLSLRCCLAGGLKIPAFDECRVQILVKNDKSAVLRCGKYNPKSLETFLFYWL